jgi:hypothetical protein
VMTWDVGILFNTADIETNSGAVEIVMQDDGNAGDPAGMGVGPNPGHGCRGNTFDNLWGENPSPTPGYLFDIGASSSGNDFRQLHISGGTADQIHVAGPNNHFGPIQQTPWGGGNMVVELTATGTVVPSNVFVTGPGAGLVTVQDLG